EPLRQEATRLAQGSKDYDGRVCLLQVVDTSERAMKLRLIVSSPSAGQNWDLCCLLREGLIALMQREHPGALPRIRAEMREATDAHDHRRELEARLAGQRTEHSDAPVNNDTGITSLTGPTGGVLPPAQPP